MTQLADAIERLRPATIWSTLPALALLLIVYYGVTTAISYRRLAHIPGPRLAAFSELWFFNATSKGDLYLEAERVLRKYGVLVRVAPVPCTDSNRLPCKDWSEHDLDRVRSIDDIPPQ
jgi:hypothetical protein